jgi:hypothetical protein
MDDSMEDQHEDRITNKDLLQANATLIAGVLIFLTLFKDLQIIPTGSIALFTIAVFLFFIQY